MREREGPTMGKRRREEMRREEEERWSKLCSAVPGNPTSEEQAGAREGPTMGKRRGEEMRRREKMVKTARQQIPS